MLPVQFHVSAGIAMMFWPKALQSHCKKLELSCLLQCNTPLDMSVRFRDLIQKILETFSVLGYGENSGNGRIYFVLTAKNCR